MEIRKRARDQKAGSEVDGRNRRETANGRSVNVSDLYEKIGRVGEGTYGIVYKARNLQTKEYVALKRCIPHNESSDGFPVTTLREIQSLRICGRHPNVVALETVAVSKNGVFLVFEFCEHDLADLIDRHYQKHKKSPFRESSVKTLLIQLLGALDYVHCHHLIHRDLKLSNLLHTRRGVLKLADFGLSRPFSSSGNNAALTPQVASLWYRPPELLLGSRQYTQSIDIWATGCIFAEFLQGMPLLNGKTEADQLNRMFHTLGVPDDLEWPDLPAMPLLQDGTIRLPDRQIFLNTLLDTFAFLSTEGLRLLCTLLRYDPNRRGTARQALTSHYFSDLPLPTTEADMPKFR